MSQRVPGRPQEQEGGPREASGAGRRSQEDPRGVSGAGKETHRLVMPQEQGRRLIASLCFLSQDLGGDSSPRYASQEEPGKCSRCTPEGVPGRCTLLYVLPGWCTCCMSPVVCPVCPFFLPCHSSSQSPSPTLLEPSSRRAFDLEWASSLRSGRDRA